jgi:hypothetical protein
MKTRIFKVKSLAVVLVGLFIVLLSAPTYSQSCTGNGITLTIRNVVQTSTTTLDYEIWINKTSANPTKLSAYAGNVLYNLDMLPAGATGTLTVLDQPSQTTFPGFAASTVTPAHVPSTRQLRWTFSPLVAEASAPTLPTNVDQKFCKFRFTSSLPFTTGFNGNLRFSTVSAGGISLNTCTVYCNGNPVSTPISIAAANLTLSTGNTQGTPLNFILNPASGPTASVLSGSATICAGASSNLSVAVTGGTSPYTVTVTDGTNNYSATGESPVSIAVNPTSTSNYSIVSVTGGGTGTGNSGSATVTVTPLTTTGSESQTVCGTSYTWPTSGQEYTASGSYTHVVGCNTATLTLTLTPATTTSESQTVCGASYTWPTSAATYNASGVYTFVSGCNTATLNLTLTPATTTSESQTVCGASYTWPTSGVSYTASGSYTHVVGCNTATLDLTLTPPTTNGSVSTSICAGASYTWPANGQLYTSAQSGVTVVTGCNTATLNLTITPAPAQPTLACYQTAALNTATCSWDVTGTQQTNTIPVTAVGTYTWANNGQTYSASGTYTGNVVNCVIQVLDLTITPVQSGVLSLKVYLEGYYLSGGQMRSALVNSGVGTNNAISDTIKVQLRSQSSPNASVLSANVLLSTNGTASISIPPSLIGGNYYIAVYHRNSLETWSSSAIAFTANTNFDFTTSSSQAYGAASMKQVEAGVWALYSGDHNQDGAITPSDLGSVATEASLFSFGYINTDLTGDGAIDGFDLGLADNNSHALLVSSHP